VEKYHQNGGIMNGIPSFKGHDGRYSSENMKIFLQNRVNEKELSIIPAFMKKYTKQQV